jgi:ribosomal protein L11 methyltransferase
MPAPGFTVAPLEEEDWVRRSQSQFGPIRISGRLWIVPSWHAPPDPAAIAVRLDPGLAFGTGSHVSTRMVLRQLESAVRPGMRVLDYGCGSGILAVVAGKFGAGEIAATDIDPQALATSIANAADNDVILNVALPESLPPGTFDLVLANILAGPLIDLEPLLAARTRPGGRILLSGILESQAAEVVAAYARDFCAGVIDAEEGWALVGGGRK